MLKPLHLAICLPVALAVAASGCGSTKKASTTTTASTPTTASTTGGTTGPTSTGATATQTTTPKQAPKKSKAHAKKPAAPKPQATVPQRIITAPKPKPEPKTPPKGKYEYPLEVQTAFISSCVAGSSTKSGCECIIAKFESRKVEEGQSLSELLGAELALQNGRRLNRRARQFAKECKSTLR
jgi:hypothetical protein